LRALSSSLSHDHDPKDFPPRALLQFLGIGAILPALSRGATTALPEPTATSGADERFLKLLGRPPATPHPVGDYIPACRVGNLLYLSTTYARVAGKPVHLGLVGGEATLEAGQLAARGAAFAVLETIIAEVGSLAAVKRIVTVTGYVASADGFYQQPVVMNGASAVMIEVFGEAAGRSTRSAIGVKTLSGNTSVAISAIVELHA
jgi:enamine deaminase RidA (YjgF/YER057c/UK114 family)